MSLKKVYSEILQSCQISVGQNFSEQNSSAPQGIAVFDLDSTLFDLSKRVTKILQHWAELAENKNRFKMECQAILQIQILKGDWGLEGPLKRLGIAKETHLEFWREIHQAWAKGFFSNHYLIHDRPLPGAVNFVQKLFANGAHILYLTGRDVPRMLSGTEASLSQWGFPLDGQRARLKLKPEASINDADFKAEEIFQLSKKYQSVWIFENEPVNINRVLAKNPSVKAVYVDTCHSGLENLNGIQNLTKVVHFNLEEDRDSR